MNDFISHPALPFIEISTIFVLTMLTFFEDKDRRHPRLNYYFLVVFGFLCLTAMFHRGLAIKIFAGSMLISTLAVEAIVSRQRRRNPTEHSQLVDPDGSQRAKP
jgi:hypothetical protein